MEARLERLVAELESVTADMAAGDLPLETLAKLIARRGAIIQDLVSSGTLDPDASHRVHAVIEAGDHTTRRLKARREALHGELVSAIQAGKLASGLAAFVPGPDSQLDTQG